MSCPVSQDEDCLMEDVVSSVEMRHLGVIGLALPRMSFSSITHSYSHISEIGRFEDKDAITWS